MARYGLVGGHSHDLLTYRGAVIVHDDRAELQFLCPHTRVVMISSGDLGCPVLQLRDHPDMQHVHFPLRREDFPRG